MDNPIFRGLNWMAMSLPWVPMDWMENAVALMVMKVTLVQDEELNRYCRTFMEYLDSQWLNNPRIPRAECSRTKKVIEIRQRLADNWL